MKFTDISLHKKITIITILIISAVVIIGSVFDILKSYNDNYSQFVNNSIVNTELVSRYCVTPLDFELESGVSDVMSKLKYYPDIEYAIVFDKNKKEFVRYQNNDNISDFEINLNESIFTKKTNKKLYVNNPIKNDGELLGYINICYSLDNLLQNTKQAILLRIIVLILLLILAYSVSLLLQRKITKPILDLAIVAGKISQDTDYNITLTKQGNDETGILYDSFLKMINKISEKEIGLVKLNKELSESLDVINQQNIEISEKEFKFRAFFNNSPVGLMFLTPEFEMIEYNNFFDSENIISEEKNKLKLINNLNSIDNKLKNRLIQLKQTISFEATLEDENSENIFYYIAIFFPVTDIENNVKQVGGIIVNDTKRKLNELDLIKAKEKAEESDRLKSAFLANMSHEIRTPMNGILGFANLLKSNDLNPDKRKKYADIIDKSTNQLLAIINDILDISKIEAGQLKINNSNFNLNLTLNDIYELILMRKEQFNKNGVKLILTTSLNDNNSFIFNDEVRIRQIIINLLGNALKFTNEGEISFGYEIVNQQYLKFYVSDTGVGITPEFRKIIFDRFRQAESNSLENTAGGTGLGLAISKGIVELLGGKIWLDSEYTNGARFYFTIPLNIDTHKDNKIVENIKSRGKETKGTQILLVEDDSFNYLYIKELLEEYKFNFHWVNNGQKAIDFCKENPDLSIILMDIQLPEMSGYDAIIKIREFNKKIPIIAQTAYAMDGDEQKYLKIGCNEYLSKPLQKDLLINTIKKYL